MDVRLCLGMPAILLRVKDFGLGLDISLVNRLVRDIAISRKDLVQKIDQENTCAKSLLFLSTVASCDIEQ